MRKTTCNNYGCKNYSNCDVNIWDESYKNRPCKKFKEEYLSMKERITINYSKKKDRMPINIYFEH